VVPRYTDELLAGYTGDEIAWEVVGGWGRPVADLTVVRPSVFAQMMPLEQWRDYCRAYPEDCEGVDRGHGAAKTGTSLGYNALWVSPTVESEIVSDNEGALVGSWLGPDGKSYLYDVEHVVDPECELVLRLQRDEEFDPSTLGGQHFAIALDTMTGRGGQQSELLRVVDSREIVADPRRGRVQVQVPSATPNSAGLPAEIPKRCERTAEAQVQAAQEHPMSETTKQNVVVGVRDQGVAKFMTERKLKTVSDLHVTIDMLDASKVEAKLMELMAGMAELVEMVKMAEGERDMTNESMGAMKAEMEDMTGKMQDMPSIEELTKKLGELEVEAKATEEELTKAKAASAKATDETKSTIDSLQAQLDAAVKELGIATEELAPVRAEQLKARAKAFTDLGLDKKTADACDSVAALERAFAAAHISERYGKQQEVEGTPVFLKSADAVSEAVESYLKGRSKATPAKDGDGRGTYTPGRGLSMLPTPAIVKSADADDTDGSQPKPAATSSLIAASCG